MTTDLSCEMLNEWKSRISREIPTPLYYQLKLLVKERIDNGQLKSGDAIPTEAEISATLDISRPTVRQCMQELVNEGFLTRQKGKGTFVTQQKIEINYIAKHESFHEIISHYGCKPLTHVLDFQRIDAIPSINEIMQLSADEPLYYLRRICMANGETMLYTESYTQADRFPDLLQYDFSTLSLYATLRDVYHAPVKMVRREIGATNASQADADMLNTRKGRAIFLVYNLAFDEHDRPIEYSVSRYRSEIIKFTNYMKC